MTGQFLTTIGLTLDIIGVVVLFRYGLPYLSRRTGSQLEWTTESERAARQKKVEQYDWRSRGALVLICAGFFLQGLAAWIC